MRTWRSRRGREGHPETRNENGVMMDDNPNDPFAKLGRLADHVVEARKAELKRLRAGEDLEDLDGDYEPVPVSTDGLAGIYTDPLPFGRPPDEPVEIDGEVPWELQDDDTDDQ